MSFFSNKLAHLRREYRTLFIIAILLTLVATIVLAVVFGVGSTDKDGKISALEISNAQLNADVMALMINGVTYSVTYLVNGTCKIGYPLIVSNVPQTVADFSDYTSINYQLKEVLLSPASVPISVLSFGPMDRPIQFPGYTPSVGANDNELQVVIGLCDPPIDAIDSLAQSGTVLYPFSHTAGSKLQLTPNCVAMSSSEQNPAHCRAESGYTAQFSSSVPTTNSFLVFTNNIPEPGNGQLRMLWGQWDYSSLMNQYDFIGTNFSMSAQFDITLPSI